MLKKLYLVFVNYFYLIELTAIHEVTQDTGENKKAEEWFTGMKQSLFFFFRCGKACILPSEIR